jgi:fumarate hydratase class II
MAIREMAPHPYRVEQDALGDVQVPAEHLWGAQTQRSHLNFPIGIERFRWGRPGLTSTRHTLLTFRKAES